MALNYEFDVFTVSAKKTPSGPVMLEMLTDLDRKMENKVARFRSPTAVAALRSADARVRGIFRAAGFEFEEDELKVKGTLFDDKEAHAVFLVRVTDGIEKTFSSAELDSDDVLARPSVDKDYDEGIAPEGAFVVLDWMNDTIAVHEGDDAEEGFDAGLDESAEAEPELEAAEESDDTYAEAVDEGILKLQQFAIEEETNPARDAQESAASETEDAPFDLGIFRTVLDDEIRAEAEEPKDETPDHFKLETPEADDTRFKIIPAAFDAKAARQADVDVESKEADTAMPEVETEFDLEEVSVAENLEVAPEQIDLSLEMDAEMTALAEVAAKADGDLKMPARRPRKPAKDRRVRVIEAPKQTRADVAAQTPPPPATPSRFGLLGQMNTPAMGILAGLLFSGAGILLISQMLA
ncbi:hypothetical protein [Neptunicoccus sediminis]|uniref:hypothetical protein n=1 Tax=Neptunicoccus sediminis TaxID=1892596 RepID=UPI000845C748|nr:hypothetical protein [Neptunicoccus sediminis]